MKPLLLVVGGPTGTYRPRDEALEARRVRPSDVRSAARVAIAGGRLRIGVAGTDADAAAVVAAALDEGARIELAVIPRRRSDLVDMFALAAGTHLERLSHGTPYPIDAGVIEGRGGERIFLNSVTAGLAAGPASLFPWSPTPGGRRRVKIEAARERTITDASAVLVMNGQCWAGRTVAPRATLTDGALDVQVLSGGRWGITRARRALHRGLHVRSRSVTRVSVARAEIDVPPNWRVDVDRRSWGRGAFSVSVLPNAADLLV